MTTKLLAGFTLAALVGPAAAHAQVDERSSTDLRNDCRLAAQILTTGEPHPHREWALERIRACNESGGAALASVWSTPPTDRDELDRLYWTTAGFLDSRILEAVRIVVIDPSNRTDVRLTGLRILAAYVNPHLDPRLSDLVPPDDPGESRRTIGSVDHRPQTEGAEPLPAGYTESITELLSRLAGADPDPVVRFAAARLHERLSPAL